MADGDTVIIEEQPPVVETAGRLGRHQHHDPANRSFPVRGVLFADAAPIITKTWYRRDVFDQGATSSCTGQAAAGVLQSSPFRMRLQRSNLTAYDTHDERFELYRAAQKVDPWPGEEPTYYGSSTDAPFRVLRDRGQIREWRWCFGADDVLRTLSHYGPVAIGINWYAGLDTVDKNGFVAITGHIRGGHAFQLTRIYVPADGNVEGGYVGAVNSWGRSWGANGRFKIRIPDLRGLLAEGGEAATVTL